MSRTSFAPVTVFSALLIAGVSISGCSREEPAAPVAEVQTQTPPQAANHPMTVAGCLRAGEASDTFVLTASEQATTPDRAGTYQLVAGQNVDLKSHVGQRVEVNGVMTAQQTAQTRAATTPAAGEKPTGTTGTPKVATTTELDIKRLEVSGIKQLSERCEQ